MTICNCRTKTGTLAIVLITALALSVTTAAVACGGSSATASSSPSAALSQAVASAAGSPAATTTAVASPFTSEDLRGLVLRPAEGRELVAGLKYRPDYSGASDLFDFRHWTLVPPERLQEAGFVDGVAAMFFTDAFLADFGRSGRSLLTTALLFQTRKGARQALKVFADSRDELWEAWRPLSPTVGANGIAQSGRQGTDNIPDIYPTTSFGMQVANIVLLVGSQGGAQSGKPFGADLLRSLAKRLLARAHDRLTQIDAAQ